jgi:excisionase family DNA binding protein
MNTWLLPDDIANLTGHTTRTVQRWCRERRIPHVRIGRLYRFTPDQVQQIQAAYGVAAITPVAAANAPNPDYAPSVVVVPMRRPA